MAATDIDKIEQSQGASKISEMLKDRDEAANESERGAWKSLILEVKGNEGKEPNPESSSHKRAAVLGGCIVREN